MMEQALDNHWGKGLLFHPKNARPRTHMTKHRACLATQLLFLLSLMTSAESGEDCVSLQLHYACRLLKPRNSHQLISHLYIVLLPYH